MLKQFVNKIIKTKKLVKNVLKSDAGTAMIMDITMIFLVFMLVLSVVMRFMPAYYKYNDLQSYAGSLCREVEMYGQIGAESDAKIISLNDKLKISPNITWSTSGRIQLNTEFTVTLDYEFEIVAFSSFSAINIPMKVVSVGKSEVFWK